MEIISSKISSLVIKVTLLQLTENSIAQVGATYEAMISGITTNSTCSIIVAAVNSAGTGMYSSTVLLLLLVHQVSYSVLVSVTNLLLLSFSPILLHLVTMIDTCI